jgi:hypothetical protein
MVVVRWEKHAVLVETIVICHHEWVLLLRLLQVGHVQGQLSMR